MDSIVKYLNNNSAAVSLLFSFVVTLATVFYVILTWKLVSETKKLRELQGEPNISITLSQKIESIRFLDIFIQNIGLGPAYDVVFKVVTDFENLSHRKINDIGFIKDGIKYLAPQQSIKSFLLDLAERHDSNNPPKAIIEVFYKSKFGKNYFESFSFNLGTYYNLRQLGTDPFYQMSQSLKKIKEYISNFNGGSTRLKVDSYNQKDRNEENKQIEKMLKAHEKKQKLQNKKT